MQIIFISFKKFTKLHRLFLSFVIVYGLSAILMPVFAQPKLTKQKTKNEFIIGYIKNGELKVFKNLIKNKVLNLNGIAGLRYVSKDTFGYTDIKGRFIAKPGIAVRFYLGELRIGTFLADTLLSYIDMSGNVQSDLLLAENRNKAALIQSLDQDGNPTNGIIIDTEFVARYLQGDLARQMDFDREDFSNGLQQLVALAQQSGKQMTYVSPEKAIERLANGLGLDYEVKDCNEKYVQPVIEGWYYDDCASCRWEQKKDENGKMISFTQYNQKNEMVVNLSNFEYDYVGNCPSLIVWAETVMAAGYHFYEKWIYQTSPVPLFKETYTFEDRNKLMERFGYAYNSSFWTTIETVFRADCAKSVQEYDKEGKHRLRVSEYDNQGKRTFYFSDYHYYSNGNLKSLTGYDAKGRKSYYEEYSETKAKERIKFVTFDPTGKVSGYTVFNN